MIKHLRKIGVEIPAVLLPNKNIDMEKWSVVACDQYTSQPEYWASVSKEVGGSASALKMILPEVYLGKNDNARIESINNVMREYVDDYVLELQKPGFILVDRKTPKSPSRKGLIMALDLEMYDFSKDSQSLIRATEGTLIERLPPRVKIRENAPLEIPHITILIDDPKKTVIEPLFEKLSSYNKIYDFDLMMNSGHIKGYMVSDEDSVSSVVGALFNLAEKNAFKLKYKVTDDKGVLLFAVGDGNHSLASAKVCWENIKKNLSEEDRQDHPARFALVEVQNIHDDCLKFEPIYRIVFNINESTVIKALETYFKNIPVMYSDKQSMNSAADFLRKDPYVHVISFVTGNGYGTVVCTNPQSNLEVATLQDFLDDYLKNHSDAYIDYVHGESIVDSLGSKQGNIGFFPSPMDKKDLFKTIIEDGILPRKTFSMGEADEKRFYLECRKIVK